MMMCPPPQNRLSSSSDSEDSSSSDSSGQESGKSSPSAGSDTSSSLESVDNVENGADRDPTAPSKEREPKMDSDYVRIEVDDASKNKLILPEDIASYLNKKFSTFISDRTWMKRFRYCPKFGQLCAGDPQCSGK